MDLNFATSTSVMLLWYLNVKGNEVSDNGTIQSALLLIQLLILLPCNLHKSIIMTLSLTSQFMELFKKNCAIAFPKVIT